MTEQGDVEQEFHQSRRKTNMQIPENATLAGHYMNTTKVGDTFKVDTRSLYGRKQAAYLSQCGKFRVVMLFEDSAQFERAT